MVALLECGHSQQKLVASSSAAVQLPMLVKMVAVLQVVKSRFSNI